MLEAVGLGSHRLAQDGVAKAGHHLAAGQRLLREGLHILPARVVSQLQGQEGQDSGPDCGRFDTTSTPIEAQNAGQRLPDDWLGLSPSCFTRHPGWGVGDVETGFETAGMLASAWTSMSQRSTSWLAGQPMHPP